MSVPARHMSSVPITGTNECKVGFHDKYSIVIRSVVADQKKMAVNVGGRKEEEQFGPVCMSRASFGLFL